MATGDLPSTWAISASVSPARRNSTSCRCSGLSCSISRKSVSCSSEAIACSSNGASSARASSAASIGDLWMARFASAQIADDAKRDGEEPGLKGVLLTGGDETRQGGERVQEDLGCRVLRLVPVAEPVIAIAQHRIPVAVEDRVEPGRVELSTLDQHVIREITYAILVVSRCSAHQSFPVVDCWCPTRLNTARGKR